VPGRKVQGFNVATEASQRYTVLLADVRHDVRAALRLLVESELGLTVIAEAHDSDTLVACLRSMCPDLLLLEWNLLAQDDLAAIVKSCCPHSRLIILVSGLDDTSHTARGIGVHGFVHKIDPPDMVLSVLRGAL
jgi:DNA-binding NarL/FixJ family response regulator